jgi:hypothetical protein
MERRVKLIMAALALAMLVAGGVRRSMKDPDSPLAALWRDFSPSAGTPAEPARDDTSEPQVGRAALWDAREGDVVSPAAAHFAEGAEPYAGAPPSHGDVINATFLPNPQPAEPAPNIPREEFQPENPNPADIAAVHPQNILPTSPQPMNAAGLGRYVVQPGDSYWTISQRVYGTGRYFQALFEHNRRYCPQPDRLPVGVPIETPDRSELERMYADLFR